MSVRLTVLVRDQKFFVLGGLDRYLRFLLREIPVAGSPSEKSRERLFPKPTAGRNPVADQEWEEFIQPDLEEEFLQKRGRVEEDLEGLQEVAPDAWELSIPLENMREWIHALNQARLCLVSRYELTEKQLELEGGPSEDYAPVLFQIRFYGFLQEWMLSVTDSL
jgi:hypothetical protein